MSDAEAQAGLLRRLAQGPVSGSRLAAELGVTRSGLWKRVEALRAAGVGIEAERGLGYRTARPLHLLDAAQIHGALEPAARPLLGGLEVAWSVDSTNARLLAQPCPDGGAQVLLAERQHAGRGRRGRRWVSPLAANLCLSIARRFATPLPRLGGLALAVGVALAEAARSLGAVDVGLKWPNDLQVAGRKLGGILIESTGELDGSPCVVIGIGLNVAMPASPAHEPDQPWTDLAREGATVDRNRVAAAILSQVLPALEAFDRDGLAPFASRFSALHVLDGQRVVVHGPRGPLQGVCQGIDNEGALRVEVEGAGETRVHAGEVSLRRAMEDGNGMAV